MEISNNILQDYVEYCSNKLIEEFGSYNSESYDPIYLYTRYKCRIIEQRCRLVKEARDLRIPSQYLDAYNGIKSDISSGQSLRKYQSRNLKRLDYDDDMLSHWGIQHFHLGSEIENDGFISRTRELLFIHFSKGAAHIIGVYQHGSWCDFDIIEKLHENWPQELSVFKTESDASNLTEEEYKTIRKKNGNVNVRVNDGTEYFCPGMGVTCNGAPTLAVLNSQKIIFMFNEQFETIKLNIQQIFSSDPEKRYSDNVTIGLEMCNNLKKFVYIIKETGFKFTIES